MTERLSVVEESKLKKILVLIESIFVGTFKEHPNATVFLTGLHSSITYRAIRDLLTGEQALPIFLASVSALVLLDVIVVATAVSLEKIKAKIRDKSEKKAEQEAIRLLEQGEGNWTEF